MEGGRDVEGIIAYVEILVEGGGKANRAGKALGDRFFLKTAAKCKDVNTKKEVDRYHYINNQIDGKIIEHNSMQECHSTEGFDTERAIGISAQGSSSKHCDRVCKVLGHVVVNVHHLGRNQVSRDKNHYE